MAIAILAGLPWVWGFPWGFPWVWVWDGYGDCNESPWACGNSVGIFDWAEIMGIMGRVSFIIAVLCFYVFLCFTYISVLLLA